MTTKELVREAAKMLDEEKPDWYENINFKKLTMHNSQKCIAGQNGLSYYEMTTKLEERSGTRYSDNALMPFGGSSQLVPLWKEEVKARTPHVRLRDKVMLALSACLPF